jgi:hypothetical protein
MGWVGKNTDEGTSAAVRSATQKAVGVDANESGKDKEEAVQQEENGDARGHKSSWGAKSRWLRIPSVNHVFALTLRIDPAKSRA